MKSNIEFLYEELRKATDGGSESMTHDDALKQISYWRDKCSQTQQVAVPQWTLTADQMPPSCTPVLAHTGNKHPIRAEWVPPKEMEVTGEEEYFGEYDEATDMYYWPKGWYEWNKNEETHWLVTEPVTHWMPLPQLPQGDKQ